MSTGEGSVMRRLLPQENLSGQQDHGLSAKAIRRRLHALVREHAAATSDTPMTDGLPLSRTTLAAEELIAALDVLLDGRLTMGAQTAAFEAEWSSWLPAAFSLMVNSGSSANLLMLAALAFPGGPHQLRSGDEVILPAVGWSTSLFPIVQMGCVPVLVDIDPVTLNLDPAQVEQALTPRTRAILAIHLLGNPCDLPRLQELADRHNLLLLEDCCEAHGAAIEGRRVGTFGALSSFSFFYSHHMTSVEGGMVCGADRRTWHDLLVSQRAHGWIRGRSDAAAWSAAHPDIDPRWLFVTTGYNVRPTDINAAIGRVQLHKLSDFVEKRQAIRRRLLARLRPFESWLAFQGELPGHSHSAFGLSLVVRPDAPFTRQALQSFLESRRIETRPIVGSNLARQPVMRHVLHKIVGPLTQADLVHRNGVMLGNHADLTATQEDYLVGCIDEFIRQAGKRAA
ncbi:MAG: DegT/DnrJ/EryC1/StrS family aminotransferase [Nitrospiraceae bacterium]